MKKLYNILLELLIEVATIISLYIFKIRKMIQDLNSFLSHGSIVCLNCLGDSNIIKNALNIIMYCVLGHGNHK